MESSVPNAPSSGGQSASSSFPRGPRFAAPVDPADISTNVPMIAVRFADAQSFICAVDPNAGPAGDLTVRTRAAPPRGSEVVLEVRWPALPNRVYIRAQVRRSWTGRKVFRLLAKERAKMTFLISIAAGDSKLPARRVYHRYCVGLPVQWRPFGARIMHHGVAEDLSAGGVGIVTPRLEIVDGAAVVVRLTAATTAPDLILTGVVRHIRAVDDEMLVGVMFQHRSSGEQRDLRRLVHVFSARGRLLG